MSDFFESTPVVSRQAIRAFEMFVSIISCLSFVFSLSALRNLPVARGLFLIKWKNKIKRDVFSAQPGSFLTGKEDGALNN